MTKPGTLYRRLSMVLAMFVVALAQAGDARAAVAFQFAAPNVRVPRDPVVNGVRFSVLHGENQRQRGLDLGLLSMSKTGSFAGLAIISGLSRITGEVSNGAVFSAVNWHSGRDAGFNGAFVNVVEDTQRAFNVGFVTIGTDTGVDLGGFNLSRSSTVQVGFLNVTDRIEGLQFGFLNMARNGFLPIFPVFNFPKR